jgi:hypothetical protein
MVVVLLLADVGREMLNSHKLRELSRSQHHREELSLRPSRMMSNEMEMMKPFEKTSLDFSAKIGGVAYSITLLAGHSLFWFATN